MCPTHTYTLIRVVSSFMGGASNTASRLKEDFLGEGPFSLGFEECLEVH